MKINYQLATEIYGGSAWCVDHRSFSVLSSILRDARSGTSIALGDIKNNTPELAFVSDRKVVTRPYGNDWEPGQLDNNDDFEAVGVININGPITNSGGASSYGMLDLASKMRRMNSDSRIKGFIILANSGGGSSAAVETMTDVIDEVRASGKDVIGLVEKGGMACSAMYMILCACSAIYAQSEMSFVGSNGTMIQFEGVPSNKEIDGVKYVSLYATKSTRKNEQFREAIDNDNYKLLTDDLLDPINERMLSKVIEYRPQLAGTDWDSGVDIFAKDGVGTYIDGFKTFSDLSNEIFESSNKINTNTNMTLEQLKSEHPSVFNEAVNAGVKQERDRVGSWLAHHSTDSAAVVEGIKSGEGISATSREELLVKATVGAKLEKLESNSAPVISQAASETPSVVEKTENEKEVESTDDVWKAAFGAK